MGTTNDHVAFAELQHQLRGRERQAALARCASSVSHELATPLSVVSGRVAMLRTSANDPAQLERYVTIIQEQLRAIGDSLQRVVAFSRTERSAPEPVDLAEVMKQAVDVMQPVAHERGITLVHTAADNPPATLDRGALLHLLTTILSAGLQGCGDPRTIRLRLQPTNPEPPPQERGRALPGPYACFSIQCPGLHLPEANRADAYQPWFSRKEGGNAGLELALAVAWGVARDNGGWVEARASDSSGTTFLVNWPLHSA
jgi:signal transduction histidine kinase